MDRVQLNRSKNNNKKSCLVDLLPLKIIQPCEICYNFSNFSLYIFRKRNKPSTQAPNNNLVTAMRDLICHLFFSVSHWWTDGKLAVSQVYWHSWAYDEIISSPAVKETLISPALINHKTAPTTVCRRRLCETGLQLAWTHTNACRSSERQKPHLGCWWRALRSGHGSPHRPKFTPVLIRVQAGTKQWRPLFRDGNRAADADRLS